MGVLEQVTKMKSEGKSDAEIRDNLVKQKVSPKEIQDAIHHSEIKNAVGNTIENNQEMPEPPSPYQERGEEPYIPPPQEEQNAYSQEYAPAPGNYGTGDYSQGRYQEGGQDPYGQTSAQGEYYQQPYDAGQGGYESSGDTAVEISEQVFDEKSREMKNKLDSLEEFRSLSRSELDRLNERIKRIESVIDRLQAAILERIGSYGRDLGSIKKEMSMMQDTFTRTMSKKNTDSKPKEKSKKAEKK